MGKRLALQKAARRYGLYSAGILEQKTNETLRMIGPDRGRFGLMLGARQGSFLAQSMALRP